MSNPSDNGKPAAAEENDAGNGSGYRLETMEDRVKALHDLITHKSLHDSVLLKNARLVGVGRGTTSWEVDIETHFCNMTGNLHGGAAATILDNLTSSAFVTLNEPGTLITSTVSRTITMTYLRPVPLYSTARIECRVVSAGRTLVNLYGEILVNGKVCVTCTHDKAIVQSRL
ncbi:hypothetical protein DV735_g5378, partial [Chaetothyriales sp. CBS 134920]